MFFASIDSFRLAGIVGGYRGGGGGGGGEGVGHFSVSSRTTFCPFDPGRGVGGRQGEKGNGRGGSKKREI